MKYIQQLDMTDCGAACLAMIASHYGSRLSIADIRNSDVLKCLKEHLR